MKTKLNQLFGSVSARFLVSWLCRDDDFDTDIGHTGVVQYAVSRRSTDFVSTESNGIESDNDGLGTNSLPETNTLFANVTFIGPGELEGDGSEIPNRPGELFNAGVLVRRNNASNLINSIITAWVTGNNLRDFSTGVNYVASPNSLRLEGISLSLIRSGGTAIRRDNLTQGQNAAVINRYTLVGNNTVVTASLVENIAAIVGLKDAAFTTGKSSRSAFGNPHGTPDFTLDSLLTQRAANLTNAQTLPVSHTVWGLTQEAFRGAFSTTGAVTGGN